MKLLILGVLAIVMLAVARRSSELRFWQWRTESRESGESGKARQRKPESRRGNSAKNGVRRCAPGAKQRNRIRRADP